MNVWLRNCFGIINQIGINQFSSLRSLDGTSSSIGKRNKVSKVVYKFDKVLMMDSRYIHIRSTNSNNPLKFMHTIADSVDKSSIPNNSLSIHQKKIQHGFSKFLRPMGRHRRNYLCFCG